jgi:hypothetical protein
MQQYSADSYKQAPETNPNEDWNASNHNLNNSPQVITFQSHRCRFNITEVNLEALTRRQENITAGCKVVTSIPDMAAPLSCQSYSKPEFMGAQFRFDVRHPEAIIKDF